MQGQGCVEEEDRYIRRFIASEQVRRALYPAAPARYIVKRRARL